MIKRLTSGVPVLPPKSTEAQTWAGGAEPTPTGTASLAHLQGGVTCLRQEWLHAALEGSWSPLRHAPGRHSSCPLALPVQFPPKPVWAPSGVLTFLSSVGTTTYKHSGNKTFFICLINTMVK